MLTFIYTAASALHFAIILYTLIREGPLNRDYASYEYGRYEYESSLQADILTDSTKQDNRTATLIEYCCVQLRYKIQQSWRYFGNICTSIYCVLYCLYCVFVLFRLPYLLFVLSVLVEGLLPLRKNSIAVTTTTTTTTITTIIINNFSSSL